VERSVLLFSVVGEREKTYNKRIVQALDKNNDNGNDNNDDNEEEKEE
jgi:hypothetical protein